MVTSWVTLVSPSTLHCDNDFPLWLLHACPHCLLPPTPFICVFLVLGHFHLPSTYTHHIPSSYLPTTVRTMVCPSRVCLGILCFTHNVFLTSFDETRHIQIHFSGHNASCKCSTDRTGLYVLQKSSELLPLRQALLSICWRHFSTPESFLCFYIFTHGLAGDT